jgi:dihydropteroate synthase-like protein
MKILVITGRMAEETVRNAVGDLADVMVIGEIAAFLTPSLLIREMKDEKRGYDLILVSGLITANFRGAEDKLGIPIRLGPKHAADLKFVLPFAEEIEFSTKEPACEILGSKKREEALERIDALERDAKAIFSMRDLKIGGDSRMKVMAEIVDATGMTEEELTSKVIEFTKKGADIIDLGIGLDASSEMVKETVEIALSLSNKPISVDTMDPRLILAALDHEIDLVLSLNEKNLEEVGEKIADKGVAAVILIDASSEDQSIVERAREIEIDKIIVDPVLSPIGQGAVDSLVRYQRFREDDKTTPLFFGVGNITETIDADSIGINALLAGLAMELNASILFTPEYSDKAKGSIGELRRSSEMMFLASERGSTPKDLGLDLLVLKEKRRRDTPPVREKEKIIAKPRTEWKRDPRGNFIIYTSNGKIYANHGDMTIVGEEAKEVLDTIINLDLVSSIDHAGYLGRELMKAELALRFNRSYVQDDEF